MDKKHSVIYGINNGRVFAPDLSDMEEVSEALNGLAKGDENFDFSGVRLLNVIDELHVPQRIMKYTLGRLELDDICEFSDDSITFRIDDGNYSNREFDSEEELREFLVSEVENENITMEDLKTLDIIQSRTNNIRFEGACQEDGEWSINIDEVTEDSDYEDAYNRMGIEFMPASKELPKSLYTDPRYMTPEELARESKRLQERVLALFAEQTKRGLV